MKNIFLENEMLEGLSESEVAAIRKQVENLNAKIEKARVAKIKRAEKANKIISDAIDKNFTNLSVEIAEAIVRLIEKNLSDLLAVVPVAEVKAKTEVAKAESSDVDSDALAENEETEIEEDEEIEEVEAVESAVANEPEKSRGLFGRFN